MVETFKFLLGKALKHDLAGSYVVLFSVGLQ